MHYFNIIFLVLILSFPSFTDANNRAKQKAIGKKQAASLVQQKYPGKVLKIKDFKKHYKVRVLQPKGRVLDVTVNKKSGLVKKGKN
ncbi:PepSY domain-containing protein [Pseudoalteromonas denitrificans]|uniref:Peptidase propeptide and YPEB domain-containing protein n=1 Tax=Pseudoalteromonas denitrificans DSM 6059 TaxID=1123010 RepID=A0A1I1R388_9GAMM|nr:hypothetical protein [Pseudoalteromonas denitrificans]SFD26023.1 hypothetical protein SAMN02745724_04028 [Pseudoalteromonas denitrificans DSM 6059]